MRLFRKITYGEFSEFVQEKKVHIMNMSSTIKKKVTLRNINCRFEYLKEDRLDGETPSRKTKKEKSSTNSIKNSL